MIQVLYALPGVLLHSLSVSIIAALSLPPGISDLAAAKHFSSLGKGGCSHTNKATVNKVLNSTVLMNQAQATYGLKHV